MLCFVKTVLQKRMPYMLISPPYWKKFMREVIAMAKQLGIPTWFMTLPCAHLRWPELFHLLARIQGNELTDKQVDALSCNERCQMLNTNPVVVAKHTRKELKHSLLTCCSLILNRLVK